MSVQMLFIIGAPRSGTTMLARMLSGHTMIQGGPETHLLTPLAHLGPWAKVDKAPYDHIIAAEAQKTFIEQLPRGEQDYWEACRAYCDVLYNRYTEAQGSRPVCLDKTPAYALILPFMMRVFPDAKYVALTRHPLALFSSYANSFFDGEYRTAHAYNPILPRYVPALAAFLRQDTVAHLHVHYEDLVRYPEIWFEKICGYIGVPYEPDAIDYGKMKLTRATPPGLGDPIGVKQHTRPSEQPVKKWVRELATSPERLGLMRQIIAQLDPADLETLGYPLETLWQPLEESTGNTVRPKRPPLDRHRLQRKLVLMGRSMAQKNGVFRKVLEKARLTTDVLLRE